MDDDSASDIKSVSVNVLSVQSPQSMESPSRSYSHESEYAETDDDCSESTEAESSYVTSSQYTSSRSGSDTDSEHSNNEAGDVSDESSVDGEMSTHSTTVSVVTRTPSAVPRDSKVDERGQEEESQSLVQNIVSQKKR